jgi:predicted helicase
MMMNGLINLGKVLYRPFDLRPIFYHHHAIDYGREELMKHMIVGNNLGLITPRQFKEEPCAFVTENITAHKSVSAYDRNYLFPLFLYPEGNSDNGKNGNSGSTIAMVFEEGTEYTERRPNINKEFYTLLEHTYGERPKPEQLLYYIYSVLYAPAYRQTYAEFLKSDFPRIPFTKDYELFKELASFGEELANLHLMKSDKLNSPIAKFEGKGSKVIDKSKKVGRNYKPDEERVYINEEMQYFEGIPEEVWNYQVGGYQVLDKYLYDRREKKLTNEEIQHYCKIATALFHTIQLQQEIDEMYAGVEEDVVERDAES